MQIGKEEIQLPLFTDDMIFCVESIEESRICKCIAGHKINTQKSIAFSYTNYEHVATKIKNIMPFTTTPKEMKYLGVNLRKHVQDMYAENDKILMKEVKDVQHTVFMDGKTQQFKAVNSS